MSGSVSLLVLKIKEWTQASSEVRVCHRKTPVIWPLTAYENLLFTVSFAIFLMLTRLSKKPWNTSSCSRYWQEEIREFSLGMKQRLGITIAFAI